ncbi:MAG: polymer-forming cytoskeletal protein, partial [Gemmatimonadales bacterium]
MRGATLAAVAAIALISSAATAQDTLVVVRPGKMPARAMQVEEWAVDVFNARSTTRIFGSDDIERNTVYTGTVAVYDGSLRVYGEIEGDLIAINADVELRYSAVVHGNVVILGGHLDEDAGARVFGGIRRHAQRVRVRRIGDRLELEGEWERQRIPTRRVRYRPRPRGGASLIIGFDETYNRVEGLPLRGGLRLHAVSGDVSTVIRGYGIFRTAGEFSTREDIGYRVEGTVAAGRMQRITVGARAFDEVHPTQDWPLARNEVGWSTLIWHRDYRDYYLQRGFAGYLAIQALPGFELKGEVARVDEASIMARDPWTLLRRDEDWRPNPFIDEGDYTLITGTLEYGDQPSRRHARSGWYLRATWEHGIGENIVERVLPLAVRDPLPATDYTFDRASVDLRLYQQIGWSGQLGLRGFWAGSIGEHPLPVQRRFSLGGPDPMNGFPFRAFSCSDEWLDPALPGLCDHVLLFQAEYRGGLGIDWVGSAWDHRPFGDDDDFPQVWDGVWFDGPVLVLFSNAGTAWLEGQDRGDLNVDAGVGIEFGSIGL